MHDLCDMTQITVPHEKLRSGLADDVSNLMAEIEEYQVTLDDYAKQCKMDENFYT